MYTVEMSFLNIFFYVFLTGFLVLYFITPCKYKYVVIAVGSYVLYGFTNIKMLSVLVVVTLITYMGGLVLEKRNKRIVLAVFFSLNIAVLVAFKYLNFIIENLNFMLLTINPFVNSIKQINIVLPVGVNWKI